MPVFYYKSRLYSWQIQDGHKFGGWFTHLGQHKTSIFSTLCHRRETQLQLERLKHLSSEDAHRRSIITHTVDSYWIPSQNKTKSKSNLKSLPNVQFFILQKAITHGKLSEVTW